MSPAQRCRARRVDAGLSQSALAHRAGVSRALVSAIESGRHQPGVDAALALAAALGSTVETLFGPAADEPVDALTGLPPAPGSVLRIARLGGRLVSTQVRVEGSAWEVCDGRAGDALPGAARQGVVLAGCDPALGLLERLARDRGIAAMAISASSHDALEALAAGRVHAAAVHFVPGGTPAARGVTVQRFGLARWRVGLAAPPGLRRRWWAAALSGRVPVVQREPGAAAQQAFLRAARGRTPIAGPRVDGHLAAARRGLAIASPAVTIEPAAAALGAAFHALETHEVELWVRADYADEPAVRSLLDLLGSAAFRHTLDCVGAYDLSTCGSRLS